MKVASVDDFREIARSRLPHFLFEYLDGGANSEITLHRNIDDLSKVKLRQRVLQDVSNLDLSVNLFDQQLRLPVILGPVGISGLYARRGEVQAAKAACKAEVPFALSTVSACPIDEVAEGVGEKFWFQLYMVRDRCFMSDLLEQAKRHCSALVFTVDMPVPGTRYRDVRSGLAGAPGLAGTLKRFVQVLRRPYWTWDVGIRGRPHVLGNVAPILGPDSGLDDFFAWMRSNFDPTVTWQDLEWIRENWNGPLIVKGVMDVEDARAAIDVGADGIVVSNHGGRQLDGVPSTIEALPLIADAVGDQTPILMDGGIRSGLDVVRALALGANAVMLGRAWVYALSAGGEFGVSHLLHLIEDEMRVAMALTGSTKVSEINRTILVDTRAQGNQARS